MFDDSLSFSTYNDFFKRRDVIKKKFRCLKDKERITYRMYLYSQRDFSTRKLDLIWEFLNEPSSSSLCPKKEQLEYYFDNKLEQYEANRLRCDDIEY